MSTYIAVSGQTLYDVCLITYGSLDYVGKLAVDNNITDLNDVDLSGIEFTYDGTLAVNQLASATLKSKYGTA